jgi:DNA-binding response OmpR family regulator
VFAARNGIDMLRQARSVAPDLIVLDLVLPDLNGFSVCEKLRKDRTTAYIPILMLTGPASLSD